MFFFSSLGGWYRNLTFAYKVVDELLTYEEARQRCKQLSVGANLMSIRDKEEEQVINDYLKGNALNYNSFIRGNLSDLSKLWIFAYIKTYSRENLTGRALKTNIGSLILKVFCKVLKSISSTCSSIDVLDVCSSLVG